MSQYQKYAPLINGTTTIDQNTVLAVNVFYTSSSYMKITETPAIIVYDLMPSIGGTMGLFVGISALSFVEIVEIFIEMITLLVKKLMNRRIPQSSS